MLVEIEVSDPIWDLLGRRHATCERDGTSSMLVFSLRTLCLSVGMFAC